MDIRKWKLAIFVTAAVVTPTLSFASTDSSCNASELRLSCSQQAADLITGIQQDNRALLHHIRDRREDRVQAELANMKQRINGLEAIEGKLGLWEQQMIDQVAVQVRQMTADGAGPAAFENLYSEAQTLAQTLRADAHAARVDARAKYLEPNLGMTELFR